MKNVVQLWRIISVLSISQKNTDLSFRHVGVIAAVSMYAFISPVDHPGRS